jgi:hypothetical protein
VKLNNLECLGFRNLFLVVHNQKEQSVIMRNLIRTALLTFTLHSCAATKPLPQMCSEFRNGRYFYNMYNESGLGHWKKLTYFITRSDTSEVVTSTHFPEDTSIYKITWTGACEYKSLRLNPKLDLDSFLIRQDPTGINHKIVKATDEYFIMKNNGRKDTIWKAR